MHGQGAEGAILAQPESAKTIYQRLGGRPAVLAAVELLYQKMLADPRLGKFFVGVDMEKLMKHQARRPAPTSACGARFRAGSRHAGATAASDAPWA